MQPVKEKRMPELDGLRGVAILAVVIAHYFGEVPHGVPFLTAGWLGVELFFVLSGFLIGGILMDNRSSPQFFSTFYIRRAFRIVPIYYIVLAVVLLSSAALRNAHAAWVPPSMPPWLYFTYVQNIAMSASGTLDGFWLLPTWTLAVEEQFYLLLPLLVFLVPKRYVVALSLFAIVTGPVLRGLVFIAAHGQAAAAYSLLPCRWDALFLGVLAAYLYREPAVLRNLLQRNALQWAALAGAWGVLFCAIADRMYGVKLFDVLGYSFAALCFAGILLMAVSGLPVRRRFENRMLGTLGRISYGLYLIHQPVLGLLHGWLRGALPEDGSLIGLGVTLLALCVSAGIAWVSWTFFESKLVQFGHRWTYARRAAVELTRAEVA
jgi:peptidoglycan/LPS O-acetylase OafA/YrhL